MNIPGLPPNTPLLHASHFWTLHVEEQFYIIWPIIILASSTIIIHRCILFSVITGLLFKLVVVVLHCSINPFRPLIGCIDYFGMGALLALYQQDDYYSRSLLPKLVKYTAVAVPCFLALLAWRVVLDVDPWYYTAPVLGICVFWARRWPMRLC